MRRPQHFALAALEGAAQKRGFSFRRPRHTLKGRQCAGEVDRVGLRLALRKAQAAVGDIVLDNCPIHTSKPTRAALAARAHWLSVEWLPKYAPELNDIETIWRDLKAHYLAHQIFTDTEVLDQSIHHAVEALNLERKPNPLANQRISA